DDVAIGASLGLLTGSTTRESSRAFTDVGIGLSPYIVTTRTSYSAPTATLGARAQVGSMVLVSGAVSWIGDLDADVEDGGASDIAMPLQVMGGASARLLDDLLVAVNTRWSAWSGTETGDA